MLVAVNTNRHAEIEVFKSNFEMGSELCADISIPTSDITLTDKGFKPAGLIPALEDDTNFPIIFDDVFLQFK